MQLGKRGCRRFSSDVGPEMEFSKGVKLIHQVLMALLKEPTYESSFERKV
jgi:hypothetical protein